MQWIMKKENLFARVAMGFILGIIFGYALPELAISTKVVGDVYLILIKMMIIPILVCAVAGGIINIQDASSLRRIGVKTVALYAVMFLACFVVSLGVAMTIRPGLGVVFENQPTWEGTLANTTVSGFLVNIFPSNIISSMANGDILPTIIFTILTSLSIVAVGAKGEPIKQVINSFSEVMFNLLRMVMETSPIGVLSLMAFSVAKYGAGLFSALGKYILCCWLACCLVFIVIMVIPTVIYTKVSLKSLLNSCGKVAMMTLSTTSSAATLPTTIRTSVDDLGTPEGISNFTLPLGCTINMCGGACSFCCLAIFVSDFYGLNLGIPTLAGMAIAATLINMAAPGIPGGGIVLGASFLSMFGLPFDLMGPISAFYRLLDMAFTTLNVEGDLVANLIISKSEKQWEPSMVNVEIGKTVKA
ncbi:MAG: dicarboxylate/amino acid:cation symporter [Anaerotignaceae bacterium]